MNHDSARVLVGTDVVRDEDVRLLTGRGTFIGDVVQPAMLWVCFVRSLHAHARLAGVETGAAQRHPGVHAVYTDVDFAPHVGDLATPGAPGLFVASYSALARGFVRCVGEPIAMVVAESLEVAHDAAALVMVDYEPLEAVMGIDEAMDPAAPVIFAEHDSNVIYRSAHRYGDTDAAFARAAHVVRERFLQHRVTNAPLECRGGVAMFSAATGDLQYTTAHQSPHALRFSLASILGLPVHHVRVVCSDIGGSFGQKTGTGREDVAVCAASYLLGRSVKWIEDRAENLTVAGHARDERLDVEAAIAADGRLLAMRVRMIVDTGAYSHTASPASGYTDAVRSLLPAAYRLEHYDFEAVAVTTNKATYGPYRGPWEVETWVRERLFDVLARTAGIDPVEFRLRNLWAAKDLPRSSVVGVELSNISQRETLLGMCELVGYEAFRREQEAARAEGRYLGIGLANSMEPGPFMPSLVRANWLHRGAPNAARGAHSR